MEERAELEAVISKGKSPARRLTKARILLKADQSEAGDGWSDSQIIAALDTNKAMIYQVRKTWVEEGLAAVLSRKPRQTPPIAPIFDGEAEAKLIALACSAPPEGFTRWSLRLLEAKVVELQIVERASDSTIGRPACRQKVALLNLLKNLKYHVCVIIAHYQRRSTPWALQARFQQFSRDSRK